MSLFGRRRRRFDPLDWRAYESAEDYAYALMLEGVETERARELLRGAFAENRLLQDRVGTDAERRARERDLRERRAEGAAAAASRLLLQVGYEPEDAWL